jgi:hypothetical protein
MFDRLGALGIAMIGLGGCSTRWGDRLRAPAPRPGARGLRLPRDLPCARGRSRGAALRRDRVPRHCRWRVGPLQAFSGGSRLVCGHVKQEHCWLANRPGRWRSSPGTARDRRRASAPGRTRRGRCGTARSAVPCTSRMGLAPVGREVGRAAGVVPRAGALLPRPGDLDRVLVG